MPDGFSDSGSTPTASMDHMIAVLAFSLFTFRTFARPSFTLINSTSFSILITMITVHRCLPTVPIATIAHLVLIFFAPILVHSVIAMPLSAASLPTPAPGQNRNMRVPRRQWRQRRWRRRRRRTLQYTWAWRAGDDAINLETADALSFHTVCRSMRLSTLLIPRMRQSICTIK